MKLTNIEEGINNLEFFHYIADLNKNDVVNSRKIFKDLKDGLSVGTLKVLRLSKQKVIKEVRF